MYASSHTIQRQNVVFRAKSETPSTIAVAPHQRLTGQRGFSPPRTLTSSNSTLQIQPKLTISAPGDKYEQEADRVSELVMRMPGPAADTPIIQRFCSECEEETQRQPVADEEEKEELIQTRRASGAILAASPRAEAQITGLRGGGQPLPESVRAYFEPRFGHDFSQIRIHSAASAAASADALAARAYTVGRDIVFASGQFSPQTITGKRLLAHELTHVIQQRHASPVLQRQGWLPAMGYRLWKCPADIKVVKLHPLPLSAQQVARGNRTGGGAVAEMEVSDVLNRDWAGTEIHEILTAGAENCAGEPFCGDVGSGGAGAKWLVGDPMKGGSLKVGGRLPSLPKKRNTFYDLHWTVPYRVDLLSRHGLTSCQAECEQTYKCAGVGKLFPSFAIKRQVTHSNIGGQIVTQIAVTKPEKR